MPVPPAAAVAAPLCSSSCRALHTDNHKKAVGVFVPKTGRTQKGRRTVPETPKDVREKVARERGRIMWLVPPSGSGDGGLVLYITSRVWLTSGSVKHKIRGHNNLCK